MSDSPKPQGYGHDAKGKAGGKSVPDGGPNITHTQPIGAVSGCGAASVNIRLVQTLIDPHPGDREQHQHTGCA